MLKQDIGEYEIKVIFWISKFVNNKKIISLGTTETQAK